MSLGVNDAVQITSWPSLGRLDRQHSWPGLPSLSEVASEGPTLGETCEGGRTTRPKSEGGWRSNIDRIWPHKASDLDEHGGRREPRYAAELLRSRAGRAGLGTTNARLCRSAPRHQPMPAGRRNLSLLGPIPAKGLGDLAFGQSASCSELFHPPLRELAHSRLELAQSRTVQSTPRPTTEPSLAFPTRRRITSIPTCFGKRDGLRAFPANAHSQECAPTLRAGAPVARGEDNAPIGGPIADNFLFVRT